jgi:hypothetical protein
MYPSRDLLASAWAYIRRRWVFILVQVCILGAGLLWSWHLPPPGWSAVALGVGAAIMSLQEGIGRREKVVWVVLLAVLLMVEMRSISKDRDEHNAEFGRIAGGITTLIDKSDQLIQLQISSRSPQAPNKEALVKEWGNASLFNIPAVKGALPTTTEPPQIQRGPRHISAEQLGSYLRGEEAASATIINDGTVEAGSFAKQLQIGLMMAGWTVGGDNVKIGDPDFFPDSLTIEVSADPASPDDNSASEAKSLIDALSKQGIEATLRYTTLAFPPNFMRIKVAGR